MTLGYATVIQLPWYSTSSWCNEYPTGYYTGRGLTRGGTGSAL